MHDGVRNQGIFTDMHVHPAVFTGCFFFLIAVVQLPLGTFPKAGTTSKEQEAYPSAQQPLLNFDRRYAHGEMCLFLQATQAGGVLLFLHIVQDF